MFFMITNGWYINMKTSRFKLVGIILILALVMKLSGGFDSIAVFSLSVQGGLLCVEGQFEQAEEKYTEALKIRPDNNTLKAQLADAQRILFETYYQQQNYEKSIYYGEKIIAYFPSDSNYLSMMAYAYLKSKNYPKAIEYYNKVLNIDPGNTIAQHNSKYANYQIENANLNSAINNVRVTRRAPSELYSLIQTNLSPDVRAEAESILDLIWSVPSGELLLRTMWQKRVPIYIIQEDESADTHERRYSNGNTIVDKIDIPLKYITMVNDTNLPAAQRIYGLTAFMHEFGHAFSRIKDPQSYDSMEEELGVDMIANNIAYRIIMGEYLNESQSQEISMSAVAGITLDGHRDLPVYSGFNQRMQNYGMSMPNVYLYSDIVAMYQRLLSEGRVNHVPNLDNLTR